MPIGGEKGIGEEVALELLRIDAVGLKQLGERAACGGGGRSSCGSGIAGSIGA